MILRSQKNRAFTLIEVLLAITIAAGLLFVAISFYQRATELRTQLIDESERLSAIRLVTDRLTGDLRTAFAEPRQGFYGGPDFLQFVHAGSPSPLNITDGALKLVTYSVVTNSAPGDSNSVVIGFNRISTPVIEFPKANTNASALSFNGGMDPAATVTNRFIEPLTRAIRFVRFRYFDGSAWRETWEGVDLPVGVEVSFGMEPFPPEEEFYPYEVFTRLIHVPAGRAGITEEFP
jgi:prepilin-type N-terminal cleavage/methylation domain-containing protein